MRDFTTLRERYLRDVVPIRLGGIATNLARIMSFSRHNANREVVERMIDESKWFIEWTVPETDIDTAAMLVELQLQLAQWQAHWACIWEEMEQRQAVMEQSGAWSQRILEMSGLLQEDISHNTIA